MSAVNFDDLEPWMQAKIRQDNPGAVPEVPAPAKPKRANRDDSAAAAKRVATGADFETELDVYHAYLEFSKYGKIRRNWIPTKVVRPPKNGIEQRVRLGPAHVDRTGWVRVLIQYNEEKASATGGLDVNAWAPSREYGEVMPVAFDAKVISLDHATYRHDVKLQHQLHDLKAAAEVGEYAFLLVLARQVGRVFAIPIQEHYQALLSGAGVKLYERAQGVGHAQPLLPSIEKRGQEISWDWIPLLQHCAPR